ncbi:MAG: hypothetical protein MUO97_04755 [Dehalococcoidia bacterium]|nr:hypothetical protein [Dehalococcoidia bacterium]
MRKSPFFGDVELSPSCYRGDVFEAVAELKRKAKFIKILGSYPWAEE